MAATFHVPVTAAQVGAYFVGQYYQVLQQQPELVHQFYSDVSTMLRVDRATRETATAMMQIHTLVMSLNFTGIEIKTAHSLESWSGGVIVMVTGSVLMKDMRDRRKFVQTFFLAPQEKGYFVLNDIFQFIEEEPIHQHPAALLAHNGFISKLNVSTVTPEPAHSYVLGGELQTREFVAPSKVEENGHVDSYNFAEQQIPQVPEAKDILENSSSEKENDSSQNTMNAARDLLQTPVEDPAVEPQKQTYASILRVVKGQSSPASQPSIQKNAPTVSEWNQVPQQNTPQQAGGQQPVSSTVANGGSRVETGEEAFPAEEEGADTGEIKSVYVRNLPPTVSPSEIEEEFKKFGKLKPEAVAIRNRKDVGVCYAFVEFEDITGVHNAIEAGTVQIAGRPAYIEERRANSNIPYRGGRRGGRGRSNYQNEAPSRGRYGSRNFGRDGGEREYKPRGNGFYRQTSRYERDFSRSHVPKNGQNPSESSS